MAKFKKPNRITIERPIFKFYRIHLYINGEEQSEEDFPVDEDGFEILEDRELNKALGTKDWEIDEIDLTPLGRKYLTYDCSNIGVDIFNDPEVKAAIDQNRDKFDKIEFIDWRGNAYTRDDLEYGNHYPMILGTRSETDEEYEVRCAEEKAKFEAKLFEEEKRRQEREKKKEQEELEEYKKLKAKYERE